MKITVIGTGYVGLVSGTCLAEVGNEVLCLDVDPAKIKILEDGGDSNIRTRPARDGETQRGGWALAFHNGCATCCALWHDSIHCRWHSTDEDGSADMKYVIAAARNIGKHMTDYKVVVDKSTVPVGTADAVNAAIEEELKKRGVRFPTAWFLTLSFWKRVLQ